MRPDDAVRLRHMLDAAEDAIGFVRGIRRDDLDRDRMRVLAIVKAIEIIGEAASRVGPETRAASPDGPGKTLSGCAID